MSKREPRSPYAKYNKKRWIYSPVYQLWREAVLDQGASSEKAVALACQHAKKMQVHACACEPNVKGCHVEPDDNDDGLI